ncbi:hypothetical protein O3P69_016142 [Scylla paramamosain]|uniref:Uncharacterized protein n=1 Tax=Scylla paramamosain TaxID=85552 RepID=A0AAW0SAW1_SCYPA
MATPRRPRFPAASGRRREGAGFLAQLQTFLLSQQGAIEALRRDVAAMGTPRRKVFSTAGLDKCDLDMSAADFRTWRRSLEDWIELNAVGDGDAARYIRLLCAPELQKALDARYPKAQWDATSAAEALESVGRDAHGFPPNRHPGAAASDALSGATSDDDVIAEAGPRKARHRPCGYCGERHQQWPVRWWQPPKGRASHSFRSSSPDRRAAHSIPPQPSRIQVRRQLQERAGLRDLAGINLPTLGATTCHFRIPGRSTQRDVYFVKALLKKPAGKSVYWDECLLKTFTQVKEVICQLAKQGLAYYDKTRPTIAITDRCKDGIGQSRPPHRESRNHSRQKHFHLHRLDSRGTGVNRGGWRTT